MRKRIAIVVGSLGILSLVWILTWKRYQEDINSPQIIESKEGESERPTRIPKPYKSKRFPAAKIKSKQPVEKIKFDTALMMKLQKPKNKGFDLLTREDIKLSGSKYSVLNNIRIVPNSIRDRYEPSQIVDEKFGKLFVREAREENDSVVLQNSRTRQLAIMTGVFKIKLFDHSNWNKLQSEYGFKLEGNFPGIRLSLLKTENSEMAPSILEKLKTDPRIERVELEILENSPVPK